ncbi:DUF7848 domain-containing protein [Streptomyces sp. NPDC005125]
MGPGNGGRIPRVQPLTRQRSCCGDRPAPAWPEVSAMTRSVFRYVDHVITHAPEGGVTAMITCVTFGCDATSGPQDDADVVQDWALAHTGRTGHSLFRREYTDHARVIRGE